MKKSFNTLALTVGVSLVAALSARADLIAYEGFNYGTGVTIQNASGGTGWAGSWGNRVGVTNTATSLGYTDLYGHTLTTSGGSAQVGYTTTSGNVASIYDQRAVSLSSSGGTYWISYLAQWIGPADAGGTAKYTRQGNLGLFTGSSTSGSGGSEKLETGRANSANYTGTPYDTWTAWNGGSVTHAIANPYSTSYALGNVTFVLMKLVIDGTTGADSAYIWFNPSDITATPDTSTADITDTGEIDLTTATMGLRLNANGNSGVYTNSVELFDEIRVGTTAADVTPVPEPAIFCMAGLGILALITLRRKK